MTILDKYNSDYHPLIEALADLEHQQWMHWAKDIMARLELPFVRRKNWENWMVPYSELPEHVKDMDRIWAVKVLETLVTDNPICPICFGFTDMRNKLHLIGESKEEK